MGESNQQNKIKKKKKFIPFFDDYSPEEASITESLDGHCCMLIDSRNKISIGEKKNLAARLVKSRMIATIDDDDFSLPTRFKSHLKIGIRNDNF